MTIEPSNRRDKSSDRDLVPEMEAGRRQEAESLLLRALEIMHAHPLTPEQREEMAQALSAQIATASTLRRFALDNDDPPCFVPTSARVHGDV